MFGLKFVREQGGRFIYTMDIQTLRVDLQKYLREQGVTEYDIRAESPTNTIPITISLSEMTHGRGINDTVYYHILVTNAKLNLESENTMPINLKFVKTISYNGTKFVYSGVNGLSRKELKDYLIKQGVTEYDLTDERGISTPWVYPISGMDRYDTNTYSDFIIVNKELTLDTVNKPTVVGLLQAITLARKVDYNHWIYSLDSSHKLTFMDLKLLALSSGATKYNASNTTATSDYGTPIIPITKVEESDGRIVTYGAFITDKELKTDLKWLALRGDNPAVKKYTRGIHLFAGNLTSVVNWLDKANTGKEIMPSSFGNPSTWNEDTVHYWIVDTASLIVDAEVKPVKAKKPKVTAVSTSPDTKRGKFIVWSPESNLAPKVVHDTRLQADVVCGKMADSHPGQSFYVCELKSGAKVVTTTTTVEL